MAKNQNLKFSPFNKGDHIYPVHTGLKRLIDETPSTKNTIKHFLNVQWEWKMSNYSTNVHAKPNNLPNLAKDRNSSAKFALVIRASADVLRRVSSF